MRIRTLCVAVAGMPLFGVSGLTQPALRFEVASIRPTPDDNAGSTIGLRMTGSQAHFSGLTLKDYIGEAYRRDPPQVIAPEWANDQRYEISATLPPGATREQVPEMLQALLGERFQLKVHMESRQFPVYALVVSKSGLKIKGTPVDPNAPPLEASNTVGVAQSSGVVVSMRGGTFAMADNKFEIKRLTLDDMALAITRFADRKTINATGLTDRFDITLEMTPEDFNLVYLRGLANNGYARGPQVQRMLDGAPANILGRYIEKTGLMLEERRAPLEVVVVDSASKTPSDN